MQRNLSETSDKYEKILKLRNDGLKWREIAEVMGMTTRQTESVWNHHKRTAEKKTILLTGTPCIVCKTPFKQENKFNRFCPRCKKKPRNDWLAAS